MCNSINNLITMILNGSHIASVSSSSQLLIIVKYNIQQIEIFKDTKYPRDVVRVNQRDQCGRKQFVAVLLINAFDSQL